MSNLHSHELEPSLLPCIGAMAQSDYRENQIFPFLGRDHYSRNILAEGATIMDNMDSLELDSVSILTLLGCLVLALFCAVLALILSKYKSL